MNNEEYLEELQKRLLDYTDRIAKLNPGYYKDRVDYDSKRDSLKVAIEAIRKEIERIESRKEGRGGVKVGRD